MPLIQRVHESGLVLAEESADEARLSRALKEIDPRYVLQLNPGGDTPGVYMVSCIVNEDQPAVRMLAWADDDGTPRQLSSGLIEEVKKWRPEARGRRGLTADDHNERLKQETERQRREQLAAISDDHRPKIERGRVTVSRAGTSKRYWQRNRKPPQSGLGGR